jgi:hypothetical protein
LDHRWNHCEWLNTVPSVLNARGAPALSIMYRLKYQPMRGCRQSQHTTTLTAVMARQVTTAGLHRCTSIEALVLIADGSRT